MTQPVSIDSPAEGQSARACPHHWVIESAAGPVSPGICQTCGEVREFENSVAGPTWRDADLLKGYRADSSERMAGLVDDYQANDVGEG